MSAEGFSGEVRVAGEFPRVQFPNREEKEAGFRAKRPKAQEVSGQTLPVRPGDHRWRFAPESSSFPSITLRSARLISH